MSQHDRNLQAALISFNKQATFVSLPKTECLTLTLVTNGKAALKINNITVTLMAPCIFLSSWYDELLLLENNQFAAKAIHFHPTFVNKSLSFEHLANTDFNEISDEHDYRLLMPFLIRNEACNGIITLLPQAYWRISEWFDLIGKESIIKSDRNQLCRVRRHLMQILLSLEEAYPGNTNKLSEETITDRVIEHIHNHYSENLSLDSLCKLVYINRTTLTRKFKAQTHRTPIEYLLHHRLHVACELLSHSILSISKIAETTGFKYESYFTRQFTAKIGMTPTQYRQSDGFETLNLGESRIIEEF